MGPIIDQRLSLIMGCAVTKKEDGGRGPFASVDGPISSHTAANAASVDGPMSSHTTANAQVRNLWVYADTKELAGDLAAARCAGEVVSDERAFEVARQMQWNQFTEDIMDEMFPSDAPAFRD